ncbi:cysteinyl-tRNA synthetase [Hypnocyclicus thermotrophus]|uniref:Cysteine--tRNA ligase n=1 Tax=Hypnocyclicus thermotrophus TaxID=1627895 RepID=A0AA46DZ75_9FUSO|nr:cysteine--tRNA ligase [Hypnocyclicus thermotrophus]TDT70600.1 cysteinyl-tRNA synthetase [Hypnocyclicus thermotrophus]
MIKIYNTLTQKLEDFKTVEPNKVKMYVCGPTVYNYIHIGNARPAVFYDTVRRYLEYKGYEVTYVQNFTDIDDKMINRANEEGIEVKEVAKKYITAYFEDTAKINLKEEGMIRPKATENIKEMIKLVKDLEEKGYAYASEGDVYFDIEKYKENYGELSHQKIDELVSGARIEVNDKKKNPLDFTLWKAAKEGEPFWGSPWGKGRPGWHLECSVMSYKFLGKDFDIHGGGQDLIFPHHENEIAQSKCGYGGNFARYWMHNGYINIKGEKMSKSKNNFFLLREVLEKYEGRILRFFILSSHYRKPIDFSDEELKMAEQGLRRIENTLIRIDEELENIKDIQDENIVELEKTYENSIAKFELSMDEDFNTAKAIGAIFELVKSINIYLDNGITKEGKETIINIKNYIKKVMIDVLGIDIKYEKKIDSNLTKDLIEFLLEIRIDAKKEKNWELADKIREKLNNLGVEIKDGKDKTTWNLKN